MSGHEPLVLVVEDEAPMRRFLVTSLSSNGFRVETAASAAEAMITATSHNPELILLDLGLPDRDGLAVTRQLREWASTPIIVLSARGREADKVEALDAGADDYVTKPFGLGELLARMRVALRHAQARAAPAQGPVLHVGPLVVDRARREVRVAGREVHLTPIEYRLACVLVENAGKVLTHAQLLRAVWGPAPGHATHGLRVHVAQLRRKIEEDSARPRLLLTEPGVGYRLRDLDPEPPP